MVTCGNCGRTLDATETTKPTYTNKYQIAPNQTITGPCVQPVNKNIGMYIEKSVSLR